MAKTEITKGDNAIISVVEEMVGGSLGPIAREQAGLPFSEGGCGIRLPSLTRGPARISGILTFQTEGHKRVGTPDLALNITPTDLPDVLQTLQSSLGPAFDPLHTFTHNMGSTWLADKQATSQAWWSDKLYAARKRSLLSQSTARDAARLIAQGTGIRSYWMQVTPSDEGCNRIPQDEYRLGLRWALGLPVLSQEHDGASCPACGKSVDIFGDHLMCCRRNNFYGRHFAVQEAFITMAQAANQPLQREAALPHFNSRSSGPALRPADVLFKP